MVRIEIWIQNLWTLEVIVSLYRESRWFAGEFAGRCNDAHVWFRGWWIISDSMACHSKVTEWGLVIGLSGRCSIKHRSNSGSSHSRTFHHWLEHLAIHGEPRIRWRRCWFSHQRHRCWPRSSQWNYRKSSTSRELELWPPHRWKISTTTTTTSATTILSRDSSTTSAISCFFSPSTTIGAAYVRFIQCSAIRNVHASDEYSSEMCRIRDEKTTDVSRIFVPPNSDWLLLHNNQQRLFRSTISIASIISKQPALLPKLRNSQMQTRFGRVMGLFLVLSKPSFLTWMS